MRRTNLLAACVVIGVLVARLGGLALGQLPPDAAPINPGQPGQPKVYMPTMSPPPGMAPAQAPNLPPPAASWQQQPAPQAPAAPTMPMPVPGAMSGPTVQPVTNAPPWPNQNGPVVPMTSTNTPLAPRPTVPAQPPALPQPLMQSAAPAGAPIAPPASVAPAAPAVQAPSIHVEKRGPDVVNLNQTLTYEIVVRNTGSAPVSRVRVEDELPPGARYIGGEPMAELAVNRLVWSLGTLEPSTERRLRVEVQPSGEGELSASATVTFSAMAGLRTKVVQPRLVLGMRGPDQAVSGEAVPLQITVSNPGTGPVTNLLLRGKLSEGLQHAQGTLVEAELGTLAPNESRNVTLTTTAVKGGRQTVDVVASADSGLEATANAGINVLGAILQAHRTGPAKCYLKGEVGFELEVANTGSAPAGYVEIVDALPPGLEFVSASEGGAFDPATHTITWRLAALPHGNRQRLAYRVKAVSVGEHVDRTIIRADRGAEARVDSTFSVEGIPALLLEVVDLEDPTEVGGDLTYEVRVVNQGSCPCTNIQITATVPEGLLPREAAGPSAHRLQGPQIVFEPLPKLATKADVVYRMKVRGMQPGDYRFKVQMTCDQLQQPVYKEESSRVYKNGQ